jgi:hypothetical protein
MSIVLGLLDTPLYYKIMNSHAMDWTNLKVNIPMELAIKFQDRERQKFLSTTPMVGKSSRRPTHSSSNTKIFCSLISNKTIKSELCKAINSFSLQVAVVAVSGEEIIFFAKETSNKKDYLEQRVKGLQSRVK